MVCNTYLYLILVVNKDVIIWCSICHIPMFEIHLHFSGKYFAQELDVPNAVKIFSNFGCSLRDILLNPIRHNALTRFPSVPGFWNASNWVRRLPKTNMACLRLKTAGPIPLQGRLPNALSSKVVIRHVTVHKNP